MPFNFTCPYCFKRTLIEETLVGKTGPCVSCGKEVTIAQAPSKHPSAASPIDSKYVKPPTGFAQRKMAAWALKAAGLLIVIAFVAIVSLYLLWPTFELLRERRNKVACMNNLQQIAMALNAYSSQYGTYPPPIVYDDKGKALHSWRVLILEQLGESSLAAAYNYDEPWDSASNSQLFADCPRVFISPSSNTGLNLESNYMLITGPGTVFPDSGPLSAQDLVQGDGLESTLLVVETDNATNEWTKPLDINVRNLNRKIGATGNNTIGGTHEGGATAVFADGSAAWLPSDLDPVLLDAVISPRGQEPIDANDYRLR